MKDTNIIRVKAYIGGCINRPYVCNELPLSGVPSEYFNDKSVRLSRMSNSMLWSNYFAITVMQQVQYVPTGSKHRGFIIGLVHGTILRIIDTWFSILK